MAITTRLAVRVPWTIRLLSLLAFEAATVAVLLRLGRYDFMRIDWSDLDGWLRDTAPEDVLGAVIRTAALVYGTWAIACTLAQAAAVLANAPRAVGSIRRATLPGARKLIDGILALTVVGGTVAPVVGAQVPALAAAELASRGDAGHTTPPPDDIADKLAIYPATAPLPPPRPGQATYTVTEADTLWGIAEAALGDPTRWTELWHLNAPRILAAGVTDPSRPQIGWVLELPAHAAGDSPPPPPQQVTVQPGDSLWSIAEHDLNASASLPVDGPTESDIAAHWRATVDLNRDRLASGDPGLIYAGEVVLLPTITTSEAEPPRPHGRASDSIPEPPESVDPPGPASTPTTMAPAHEPSSSTTSPAEAPAPAPPQRQPTADDDSDRAWPIGLAAAGMATVGLVSWLDRRRRAQHRRRPAGHRPVAPAPALEATEAELRATASSADPRLLDAALRAAAARPDGLPPLRWVEVDKDTVLLVLGQPAVAPPGFDQERPDRWRSTIDDDRLDGLAHDIVPPLPLLCPVGETNDGAELLIDLETYPVLEVAAEDEALRQAFLAAVAVAVATEPWCSPRRVLTVGMPDDVVSLPSIEAIPSLSEALDIAEQHVDHVTRSLLATRSTSVAQARATGEIPDAFDPLVIVVARPPHDSEAHRIATLSKGPHHATSIVLAGEPGLELGSSQRCAIDADGTLHLDDIDPAPHAGRLHSDDLARVNTLLDGALRDETQPVEPPPAPPSLGPTAPDLQTLLADIDVVIRVLGDVSALRADPTADSLAWPDSWTLPLSIDRQRALEVLTYLVLRAGPVDREDLEAAMFPAGTNAPHTFHNAVTGARRAIGEALFPLPENGAYLLSERVASDYGLFCELTARAAQTPDVDERATLTHEALSLIQGEPFVGAGRGFAWVGPHRGMIVAQVIDAAEQLAEDCLDAGDWRGAEWAARQGLRAFPADERMHRILMRAAHTAGNTPGIHRAYQDLLDALADPDTGVEPEDTVHQETLELLERLTSRAVG
jgi:nucleoid-associated protein YgaU/DNA-binding SARP family transcriptional activator